MAQTIVQISFKLNVPGKEYEQAITSLAQQVADVAGMQWKIWLLNEASHEAGGTLLFEEEELALAFLGGPLIAQIKGAPIIADFRAAEFDVLSTLTAITRGPVTTSVGPQHTVEMSTLKRSE